MKYFRFRHSFDNFCGCFIKVLIVSAYRFKRIPAFGLQCGFLKRRVWVTIPPLCQPHSPQYIPNSFGNFTFF